MARVVLRSGRYALPFGTLDVTLDQASLRWGSRELVGFVPADELQVEGMRNLYRSPGLGAPLAAARVPLSPEQGFQVAPKLRLPATALLLIPDAREQLASGHLHGSLSVRTIFDASSVASTASRCRWNTTRPPRWRWDLPNPACGRASIRGFLFGDLFGRAPTTLVALEPHRRGASRWCSCMARRPVPAAGPTC